MITIKSWSGGQHGEGPRVLAAASRCIRGVLSTNTSSLRPVSMGKKDGKADCTDLQLLLGICVN